LPCLVLVAPSLCLLQTIPCLVYRPELLLPDSSARLQEHIGMHQGNATQTGQKT